MKTIQKVDYKNVISFAGAFIAFLIGSGFATGQEIVQYFVSYGYWGLAATLVVFFLLAFVGISFINTGYNEQFENGSMVFEHYCGKSIGKFFDYFSILFIYMSFMVMIGGTGATFNQQYNLPVSLGGIIMAVLASSTVIFGLNKIVDVIGKIGPVIVVLTIFLGISGIIMNPDGLTKVNEVLPTLNILKASEGGWFLAAGSYVGFCMLWLAAFMTAMGKNANSQKEGTLGAFCGALFFSLAVAVITVGLLANLSDIAGSLVPNLILANKISHLLGMVFSIVVLLGIYTTSVPLLWTVCARVAKEKTRKFKITTISLAAIGTFLGLLVPFDKLVNIVYVINGYVGIFLLLLMIIKAIKSKSSKTL